MELCQESELTGQAPCLIADSVLLPGKQNDKGGPRLAGAGHPAVDIDKSSISRVKADSDLGCRPRADVITGKAIFWDTLYLIRLREDWDSRQSFHAKRLSEIRELDVQLRQAAAQSPDQAQVLTVPDLPERSKLGLRRQLSKLGVSKFMDKRHEAVQRYLDTLLSQISTISADRNLQAFFSEAASSRQDKELLDSMRLESRADISLKTLQGHWRQTGVEQDHIWTIEESGHVLLDGEHRAGLDVEATGDKMQLTIARADGRQVDLERSTAQHIFWHLPGEEDLEWTRDADLEKPGGAVLV